MGIRGGISGGLALAVIAAAALGSGTAAGVERAVSCTLEAGRLTIDSNGPDPTIARRGLAIVVSDFDGERSCRGGDPTVENVDTIVLRGGDNATLDMREGPFAPGATPEGYGASEIEIRVPVRGFFGPRLEIMLGAGKQVVRAGVLADGRGGLNLNPDRERGDGDADLIFGRGRGIRAPEPPTIHGGPGDDKLTARGGQGFEGPWPFDGPALLGAGGDDRVIGSDGELTLLAGGPGADKLRGGSGLDLIAGGRGRDSIAAGRGPDLIGLDDGDRDRADCGRGRDVYGADRKDRLRRCERDVDRKAGRLRSLIEARSSNPTPATAPGRE